MPFAKSAFQQPHPIRQQPQRAIEQQIVVDALHGPGALPASVAEMGEFVSKRTVCVLADRAVVLRTELPAVNLGHSASIPRTSGLRFAAACALRLLMGRGGV